MGKKVVLASASRNSNGKMGGAHTKTPPTEIGAIFIK